MLYCVTVFFWTVPLSNRVVVDSVVAFGGTTTTGSVTTGAEVTIAGGGVTGVTSRVVVSLTVRSVEQLDIQPSERPTQVANAMFVMIFIMNTPIVNRRVAPEPTREERDGLVGLCSHRSLAHPPSYPGIQQQSPCRSRRLKDMINKAFLISRRSSTAIIMYFLPTERFLHRDFRRESQAFSLRPRGTSVAVYSTTMPVRRAEKSRSKLRRSGQK